MARNSEESAENVVNLVIEGLASDRKEDKQKALELVLREFVDEEEKFQRLKEVVQWD